MLFHFEGGFIASGEDDMEIVAFGSWQAIFTLDDFSFPTVEE